MRAALSRIYRGETRIDFIGKRKLWFLISGVILTASIALLVFKGLNYGIEFEGGLQVQAPVAEDGPLGDTSDLEVISAVRGSLGEVGASDAQIQVASREGERTVIVQTKEVAGPAAERVKDAVSETVGAPITDSSEIGEKWGAEITQKAVRALVIFILVTIAFITFRFEFKMAIAAIIALLHDLTITAGVYALVGFEVTPATVVAILTILGYSLYDTVVVFDKVEEETTAFAASGRMTYQDAANLATNEVFMRSLNTSLTTLLPVAALLFVGAGLLGAETLKDLALALLVGLLMGAYSSVFIATPVLAYWKEREPKYRNVKEKVLRDARRAPALQPVAAGAPQEAAEPAAVQPRRATATRPASRPRTGSKKAKRRKRR